MNSIPSPATAPLRVLVALCTASMLVTAAASGAHRPPSDAARFAADADAWITDALTRLEVVPGLVLAVVVDDQTVLAQGFGLADLEHDVDATSDTVYYIASATKSFTALAAAILDARGEIDLASSLASHLDGVEMAPELVPDRVTLTDLLTHTSGIDNSPIAFRLAYTGQHDPDLLWRLLASSTPTEDAPLGTFRYTNVGYNILGMILDRETGMRWQDQLAATIFEPLGMARTTAYASRPVAGGWPRAMPYVGVVPGGPERIPLEKADETMQSAGGMMTTARDLARWLTFQINLGRLDGRPIVDADVVRRTHEPLVATGEEGRPPFGQTAYGLGWSHGALHDHRVLHHSGGFPGFRSLVSFMPDDRVGVAVLVNEGSIGFRLADVVGVWAYEWWLDVPAGERTASGDADALVARRAQLVERVAADRAKRAARTWALSRPLGDYVGRYANSLYGTVEIGEHEGRLNVRLGNLSCVSEPYERPETMRVELVPGSGRVLRFEPETGPVERIQLDGDTYERVD